jgi:hypothetical protein
LISKNNVRNDFNDFLCAKGRDYIVPFKVRDPLFVGLAVSVVLGAGLTVSDRFADLVRWRSILWTGFWGFVTAAFYATSYLVDHGILTQNEAMGIPDLRAQMAA